MPAAMMLIATPDTTWSPLWLTQAKPCIQDKTTATSTPKPSANAVDW
jgi:hypothetical protein